MSTKNIELIPGKIYFFSYGKQLSIIGRYKGDEITKHLLYDYLKNWQGYEQFLTNNCYIQKSGIEEIREASDAEKQSFVRHAIANKSM